MKRLHITATVLSAVLISGIAMAQNSPESQGGRGQQGRPHFRQRRGPQEGFAFNRQRGMRGGPGGQQGQRGPAQGFRGQRGGLGGECKRGLSPEVLKKAGATDEQIAQVKKTQDEHQLKQVDLKATAEKAQLQLRQLMASDKPNKDAIFAAIDKVSAARAAFMKSRISSKLKGREILGDEVTKKLKELAPRKGRGNGPAGQKPRCGRAEVEGEPPAEEAEV